MTYLLDTCVLVDYLRAKEPAVKFLEGLETVPALSVITIMEFTAGAKSVHEENQLGQLFSTLDVVEVDRHVSEKAGQYLKQYERSHGVDPPDVLIAATAQHHGLDLAMHNPKHFPMCKSLKRPYKP